MGPSMSIDGVARGSRWPCPRAAGFNGAVDEHRRSPAPIRYMAIAPPGFNGAVDEHRRSHQPGEPDRNSETVLQWGRR